MREDIATIGLIKLLRYYSKFQTIRICIIPGSVIV